MATISPLKGIRYNLDLIKKMEDVVTPPWDVISSEEQDAYYQRHPYNIIRLILGKTLPQDNEKNNRYTRTSEFFENWQREGILVKDDQPSLYVYHIEYIVNGHKRKRRGFISLVKLEDFGEGTIRPHEMMYSSARLDRLKLIETCHANFSPVFSLYSDSQDSVMAILESGINSKPLIEFEDLFHIKHKLWAVQEKTVVNEVVLAMKNKSLLIADGHHRYKAALDYRNNLRARCPHLKETGLFNYVMMYLCNLYSPGLTILPAHRLLSNSINFDLEDFLKRVQGNFVVKPHRFDKDNKLRVMRHFSRDLEKMDLSFGMYAKEDSCYYILMPREKVMENASNIEADFKDLDAAVFTHLILEKILGFTSKDMDDQGLIKYTPDIDEAVKLVDNGDIKVAFLLNPTKVEHVQRIASKGLIMPHKSTYFYPKVMVGLVIHKIQL